MDRQHDFTLSRRGVIRLMGGAAFSAAILAACGDDDDGGSTGTGGNGGGGGGGNAAAAGDELAQLLGIDPASSGSGMSWTMGAVLALSGNGSFYGKTMSRGIDLAVKHIKAAGGPDITVDYHDHKSGDAQAGVNAITELGSAGVAAKLASYADDLGAMLEGTAQYKVFTLDGGGGTSIFAQAKPFFWGTRAITPNDALPGLLRWVKETNGDASTVGLTGWDVGEPSNSIVKEDILQKIDDAGFEFNNLYELFTPNTSDFAQILPKLKDNEPDVLLFGGYGQDPGHFLNQSLTSGLESQIVGFEFTPDGVEASRGTYDQTGWTFAYDFFDAAHPISPLAKLFVREFEAEYGEPPDFYAANYYEDTLGMWEIIRRVLANGGDINRGEDLDAGLQEELTLVSVYGGDESTVGSYSLDAETHSVSQRPMGVFEYKGGEVTPKAYFNLDADDFELA